MKSFTRVACYALFLSLVPLSYTYADTSMDEEEEEVLTLQEAAALINSLGTAKDAVGGNVGSPIKGYYDIYARQLSFREKSKVFRGSIELRRAAFEGNRTPALHRAKETQNKVFRAETAAYQASLKEMEEQYMDEMDQGSKKSKKSKKDVVSVPEPDIVASNEDSSDEEGGKVLKEVPIPADADDSEDAPDVKKKVVTSDDAPDFDPSNL